MSNSQHIIALLKSYIEKDENQFYSIAMQAAAKEARQGHSQVALAIRSLVEEARDKSKRSFASPYNQSKASQNDVAGLLAISEPSIRLSNMVLPQEIKQKLERVIHEYRQRDNLLLYNLKPRRKLLLVGPPGTGKTMTAQALAGELHFHLLTVTLESVISKYMGETAAKLRLIFDSMDAVSGVYFFDEFDAIGAKRSATNDVGEIRRVLNSFLQFLENDYSESLVIAATNHPELLDPALFRRFDDVIEYTLPDRKMAECILKNSLALFDTKKVKWKSVLDAVNGISQADITKVATEAAKVAVLEGKTIITNREFDMALADRPINLGNKTKVAI